MNEKEILCRIADEFDQMEVEDATRTEKAIADILIKEGWLETRPVMEILNWSDSLEEKVAWVEYRAIFGADQD